MAAAAARNSRRVTGIAIYYAHRRGPPMHRIALSIAALACAFAPATAIAQVQNNGSKAATYITDEDVKAVNALPGIDRQLVSVDVGKTNVQVGIIHRAAPAAGAARGTGAGAGAGAAGGAGAGAGAAAAAQPCGEQGTPPPGSAGGGISHDGQTETYVI